MNLMLQKILLFSFSLFLFDSGSQLNNLNVESTVNSGEIKVTVLMFSNLSSTSAACQRLSNY